jgi:hypothetical protein
MINLIGNSTNLINWNQFESQLPNYTDIINVVSLEKSVVDTFSTFVEQQLSNVNVIQLKPGAMFISSQDKFLSSSHNNYFCQVSSSNWGHAVFINDQAIYNEKQGVVFEIITKNTKFSANNVGWKDMCFLLGY